MKIAMLVYFGLVGALSAGCATLTAPAYSPKYELIDSIRVNRKPSEKLAIGEINPTDTKAKVNKIIIRGSTLLSPYGSFPKYIEQAFKTDLTELGIYDSNSTNKVNLELLQNDISTSSSGGAGVIEIRLRILKSNQIALDQIYRAEISFESAFSANEALPAAQIAYGRLVQALTAKVLSDPTFQRTIEKRM